MVIQFSVPGKPQGKGRPRVTSNGTYTPDKTRHYEELVRWCWRVQSGKTLNNTPLCVTITAYFEPPKSTSKKKRDALIGTPHLFKPDADNISKIILDALNGHAFSDDRFVSMLTVNKEYGDKNKVEVSIMDMFDL